MSQPAPRRSLIDLVITVYERTVRDALAPGVVSEIAAGSAFPFARRTLLVNNVVDRAAIVRLADECIRGGDLDHVVFVADHLEAALRATALTRDELEPVPYFTDWAIVAATMPGPEWVLHWDAEARMVSPVDWVTPALALFERDPRVLVANPHWGMPTVERETFEHVGPFALGHGFSDQVWLARRSELARPIYHDRSLARLRYPVAHIGHIFEARVDAHIRRNGRLRATYLDATYRHPPNMGVAYPARSPMQTLRYVRNRAVTSVITHLPLKPHSLRYL